MQPLNNLVILRGNLGADPKLNKTGAGVSVCNFSIATNEYYTDKNGDRQQRVEWHRITAWGKTAELCGEYLSKGREVTIMGKLQTQEWDKDGVKRYTTEVHTTNVQFGRRPDGGRGDDIEDAPEVDPAF